MSKTKKIKTNGKLNTEAPAPEYTSFAQLMGDSGLNKYGTLSSDEYKRQLDSMSSSELKLHAEKHGLRAVNSRQLIIKNLVSKFLIYANQFAEKTPSVVKNDTQLEMDAEIQKLLSRAR